MREKVIFPTNVPVTVTLAFQDGLDVEGRFGDQVMYTPRRRARDVCRADGAHQDRGARNRQRSAFHDVQSREAQWQSPMDRVGS